MVLLFKIRCRPSYSSLRPARVLVTALSDQVQPWHTQYPSEQVQPLGQLSQIWQRPWYCSTFQIRQGLGAALASQYNPGYSSFRSSTAFGIAISDQVQSLIRLSQIKYGPLYSSLILGTVLDTAQSDQVQPWYRSLRSGTALGTALSDQVMPLVQLLRQLLVQYSQNRYNPLYSSPAIPVQYSPWYRSLRSYIHPSAPPSQIRYSRRSGTALKTTQLSQIRNSRWHRSLRSGTALGVTLLDQVHNLVQLSLSLVKYSSWYLSVESSSSIKYCHPRVSSHRLTSAQPLAQLWELSWVQILQIMQVQLNALLIFLFGHNWYVRLPLT